MTLRFEWDRYKAASNLRKHGVSFEEAITVFDNALALIFDDEDHSVAEHREVIIGYSNFNRLMLVCFTEHEKEVIRIFSARPANRRERIDHEENSGI
jgi:uncharacterized DUF497 family protein